MPEKAAENEDLLLGKDLDLLGVKLRSGRPEMVRSEDPQNYSNQKGSETTDNTL